MQRLSKGHREEGAGAQREGEEGGSVERRHKQERLERSFAEVFLGDDTQRGRLCVGAGADEGGQVYCVCMAPVCVCACVCVCARACVCTHVSRTCVCVCACEFLPV